MTLAFTTSAPPVLRTFKSHQHVLRKCPHPVLRNRRVRSCAIIAAVQGWAETRVAIPQVDESAAPSGNAKLPGVHFVEPPSISGDDLLRIIRGDTPDAWVNEIVRSFLGWKQRDDGSWSDEFVKPAWKKAYPNGPPNFIGKVDDYSPEIDRPVKLAMQRLARSIPPEHKQILKEVMKPLGFRGWKVADLTPNRTRRATAVNWILYWYRVHYPDYEWS